MIDLTFISKSYNKLRVLNSISLKFAQGRTTALLGPNGSGKTTIIKTVLGLVRSDAGTVHVDGENVGQTWQYRSKIGYMPQIARYPDNLSVNELLLMIADLRNESPERMNSLIETFQLDAHLRKSMKSLSGGTRQKVSAVAALMFDTPILILDEPTAGLDPLMARNLKDIVLEEKRRGKTIVLTTHVLSEIEELADEIAFILEGDVVFHGAKEELLASTGNSNFENAITMLQSSRTLGRAA